MLESTIMSMQIICLYRWLNYYSQRIKQIIIVEEMTQKLFLGVGSIFLSSAFNPSATARIKKGKYKTDELNGEQWRGNMLLLNLDIGQSHGLQLFAYESTLPTKALYLHLTEIWKCFEHI